MAKGTLFVIFPLFYFFFFPLLFYDTRNVQESGRRKLGKQSLYLCLTFERPFFSQADTGAKILRLENCRYEEKPDSKI